MTASPPGRLLIYGAGGYTGRLLAAEARARGLDVVLAGRRGNRLAPMAERLGVSFRVCPVDDPEALARAFADTAVVINSAGPFEITARPVLEACLRAGAHYLDVAGEMGALWLASRYDKQAARAGVMVMPGAGFVYAASDCLAAHVAAALPEAKYLRLGFSHGDQISRGSLASMLSLADGTVPIRREGRLRAVPAGRLEHAFDYGKGARVSMAIPWPDAFTAYRTTGIPNIAGYLEADAWMRTAYRLAAAVNATRDGELVHRLLAKFAALAPEGPSEAQRAASPKVIVAEAEDGYRRVVTARLHTPNVYTFTQHCTIAIAARALAGDFSPGFRTPAQAYGPDFVLDLPGVRREDAQRPRLR